MKKCFALVRSVYHRDPEQMTDETFASLLNEALWIKQFEAEALAARLVSFLSGNRND